jgi:arylsulfatase K
MPHKNIILFHAESYDGRMLGLLGHPALRNATPNIDRIAREGVVFENAYSSHPICCPSRANMWSGRYTHNCESWNNFKGLESGMWNLYDELPKTHALRRYGKLDCFSGGHTQLARLSAWLGPAGIDKPVFDEDHAQTYAVADNHDTRCHQKDWKHIDNAIEFLREQKAQKEGPGETKPFFLNVSTGLVHAAFETNNYWLEKIPEELVDIPPLDESEHPARTYQQMAKAWRFGFDDETVRKVRRIYMAMCAETDALVGELYEAMQELNLAEDTYFIFSSDHGEMAMEHQDWYKMTLYEGSARVPMVMAGPGIVAGQRRRNLVSLIDLCPTMLAMTGLEGPGNLDGESLLPLAKGETDRSRDWAYACFMGCTANTSEFMLRKDRWKYIAYGDFEPQLYDLENDPEELLDIAQQKPEIIRRLDADLRELVDYDKTHQDWIRYCKNAFGEWRRQAKRGMYMDGNYGLTANPSNDYMKIMDNAFTGFDEEDEKRLEEWIGS